MRVTAANAPTTHPLLLPVPQAQAEAETDCNKRVLALRV
jgi:hypothetical protein